MRRYAITLVILLLLVHGGDVPAAPLDAEGCSKLKSELAQLEQSGVRGSLAKGPEWAKTNLTPDRVEQVRRLIEVDEQMLFRCSGKPLVLIPTEPEADPSAEGKDGDPPASAKPKAADKKPAAALPKKAAIDPSAKGGPAAPEAVPAKKPAVKAATPASDVPANPPAAKAAAKSAAPAKEGAGKANAKASELPWSPKGEAAKTAKAKPKEKTNDAYQPPRPGDPNADPFANQAAPAGKSAPAK
jgi:hypothetical protein